MFWDDDNVREELRISWRVNAVAEVDFYAGRLRLEWDDDGYRSTADDHLSRGIPGVYVWYAVPEFSDDSPVEAAYVGESGNMRGRLDDYGSVRVVAIPTSTEERLVSNLSRLKNRGCRIFLGLVYDALIGNRKWVPMRKGERLVVEAAMVVHGATIRGHRMINVAAGSATHRIDDLVNQQGA